MGNNIYSSITSGAISGIGSSLQFGGDGFQLTGFNSSKFAGSVIGSLTSTLGGGGYGANQLGAAVGNLSQLALAGNAQERAQAAGNFQGGGWGAVGGILGGIMAQNIMTRRKEEEQKVMAENLDKFIKENGHQGGYMAGTDSKDLFKNLSDYWSKNTGGNVSQEDIENRFLLLNGTKPEMLADPAKRGQALESLHNRINSGDETLVLPNSNTVGGYTSEFDKSNGYDAARQQAFERIAAAQMAQQNAAMASFIDFKNNSSGFNNPRIYNSEAEAYATEYANSSGRNGYNPNPFRSGVSMTFDQMVALQNGTLSTGMIPGLQGRKPTNSEMAVIMLTMGMIGALPMALAPEIGLTAAASMSGLQSGITSVMVNDLTNKNANTANNLTAFGSGYVMGGASTLIGLAPGISLLAKFSYGAIAGAIADLGVQKIESIYDQHFSGYDFYRTGLNAFGTSFSTGVTQLLKQPLSNVYPMSPFETQISNSLYSYANWMLTKWPTIYSGAYTYGSQH
jgi:hypothetical protein